jgi:nitrous oxidase accessory protein NosD
VEENQCRENGMAGIGVEDRAAPLIRRNQCVGNEHAGIGARTNASPRIVDNECRENRQAGIGLGACETGKAKLRGNRILENGMVGIGVQSGWRVEIVDNELSREGGLPPMIMVFEGAEAVIRENRIVVRGVAGVRVAGRAKVTGNRFDGETMRRAGPPHHGVWALEGATVTVARNEFRALRHGVYASGASIVAVANRIEGFAGTAVVVERPQGVPDLLDNLAISADAGSVAVRVDGEVLAGGGNRVESPK